MANASVAYAASETIFLGGFLTAIPLSITADMIIVSAGIIFVKT
jgi:hypothetical protein